MAKRKGSGFSVKLGSNLVVGMGSVSLNGIQVDQMETTAFGDSWKTFMAGMKDGGDLSFDGFFDPDDATGQDVLRAANLNGTNVTNLRVYIDNTSYFEPCQTTGYFSPTLTSNQLTQKSWVNIITWDVKGDKSGVSQTSFKAKVSGCMVLV